MLLALDTPDKIAQAAQNPKQFLVTLEEECVGPAAMKLAIAKIRPRIEPALNKKGLAWEDVLPALLALNTLEKIEAAAADPEAFLLKMEEQVAGPAAMKLAVARLRPKVEPSLKQNSSRTQAELEWADVAPALQVRSTRGAVGGGMGQERGRGGGGDTLRARGAERRRALGGSSGRRHAAWGSRTNESLSGSRGANWPWRTQATSQLGRSCGGRAGRASARQRSSGTPASSM